jgi:hypothetical protein
MRSDVATGAKVDLSGFSTKGAANATYQNKVPLQYPPKCLLRNPAFLKDQCQTLDEGNAAVIIGVCYDKVEDWIAPPA